jgi:hypothetical protein
VQWADSEAKFLLNFVKRPNGDPLADHPHSYEHDPDTLEIIYENSTRRSCSPAKRVESCQLAA